MLQDIINTTEDRDPALAARMPRANDSMLENVEKAAALPVPPAAGRAKGRPGRRGFFKRRR